MLFNKGLTKVREANLRKFWSARSRFTKGKKSFLVNQCFASDEVREQRGRGEAEEV
jgi:hypothetical protein